MAQAPEPLTRVRGAMDDWFKARGLASTFEVQKLRWGPRSDDPAAQWLKLELRFVTEGTDQEQEDQRFAGAVQKFQLANNAPLADTLFFKLLHVADIPLEETRITVAVLEHTFAIVRDRASGRLRFELTLDRQVRTEVQLAGLVGATPAQQPQANVPGLIQAAALPDQVQRFLQDFFARRNSAARLPHHSSPAAHAALWAWMSRAFAGIVIASEILGEFCRSLSIGDTAQGRLAVLPGWWLCGREWACSRPVTATPFGKHQADLERFANELMRALQGHLARAGR
jgi:hypothetical protein